MTSEWRNRRPGECWYVRMEHGTVEPIVGGDYLIETRRRSESWTVPEAGTSDVWIWMKLGAHPARPEDEQAWRRAGSPRTWTVEVDVAEDREGASRALTETVHADPGELVQDEVRPSPDDTMYWLAGRNVSHDDLAALPTEPARLKQHFLEGFDGRGSLGGEPVDVDYWLFESASNLVTQMPASPQVRVAAFHMLADLPTTQELGPVTDAFARHGTAVAIHVAVRENGVHEIRLLLDLATGTGLGTDVHVVEPSTHRPWAEPGLRLFYEVVEAAYWTDVPEAAL